MAIRNERSRSEFDLSPELAELIHQSKQIFIDHQSSKGLAEAIISEQANFKMKDRVHGLGKEVAILEMERQILGKSNYSKDEVELAGMKIALAQLPESSDHLKAAIKLSESKALKAGKRAPVTNLIRNYAGGTFVGTTTDRMELLDRRVSLCMDTFKAIPDDPKPLTDLATSIFAEDKKIVGMDRYMATTRLFESVAKLKQPKI